MEWRHQVSTDWLKARRDVITATELIGLRAGFTKLTKAQKAGTKVAPAFAALWGSKHSVMDPDPTSVGAAARGHYLEPYAVEEYSLQSGEKYWHWDDCIICNNGLGFSPDAMDVGQVHEDVKFNVSKGTLRSDSGMHGYTTMPKSIMEVKSYGIENHMKNMVVDKMQLKERYQIAAAMLVLPTLETGKLLHYCPQLEQFSMYVREYTRDELTKEMEELSDILDIWQKTCRYFDSQTSEMESAYEEQEFIRMYQLDNDPFAV